MDALSSRNEPVLNMTGQTCPSSEHKLWRRGGNCYMGLDAAFQKSCFLRSELTSPKRLMLQKFVA